MNSFSYTVLGLTLFGVLLIAAATFSHKYDYSRPLLQISHEQEQLNASDLKKLNGNIVSLQNNGSINPAWIITGRWTISSISNNANLSGDQKIKFNANLTMANIDGSNSHRHRLVSFSLSNITFQNRTAILVGTIALTTAGDEIEGFNKTRINEIPVVIKIMNLRTISIDLNRNMTKGHFGTTPIFGKAT